MRLAWKRNIIKVYVMEIQNGKQEKTEYRKVLTCCIGED
jgi:hypothetical protein